MNFPGPIGMSLSKYVASTSCPNNLTDVATETAFHHHQAVVESFGSFRDGRSDHSFGGIEEVW